LVAVGVVIVTAATILVVEVAAPSKGSSEGSALPAAARALEGRILAEGQDGTLFLSYPDGSHSTVLRPRAFGAGEKPLMVDMDEAVIALSADKFADSDALAGTLPAGSRIVGADPFANGAKAVVVVTGHTGPGFSSAVSVVTLTDHRTVSLGTANDAAGDPHGLGAFVTVASANQPKGFPPDGVSGLADSQVELRDSGSSALILATAAQLNRDINQDPNQPVNLTVFPDNNGGKVAVMLNPIGGGESNSSMVILDRNGHTLGAVGPGSGPTEYTTPYWSPDNTALAYATFGSVGTTLAVINGSYHIAAQPLQPTTSVGRCAWSPDSAWVLCLAASTFTENWLLASNDDTLTPVYSLPARGDPVVWLP